MNSGRRINSARECRESRIGSDGITAKCRSSIGNEPDQRRLCSLSEKKPLGPMSCFHTKINPSKRLGKAFTERIKGSKTWLETRPHLTNASVLVLSLTEMGDPP